MSTASPSAEPGWREQKKARTRQLLQEQALRLFLEKGALQIVELRAAQQSGDVRAIGKLAHSLKGSASTFGAGSLAARCGELQVRAATGDAADTARVLDSVDAAYSLASTALREELVGRIRSGERR